MYVSPVARSIGCPAKLQLRHSGGGAQLLFLTSQVAVKLFWPVAWQLREVAGIGGAQLLYGT
jgi:hypothetical protein